MGWETVNGADLEYPFALAAQAVKTGREDVCEVVARTRRIYDEAQRLNRQVTELRAENLRLRHENEFMLRLIGEGENDG